MLLKDVYIVFSHYFRGKIKPTHFLIFYCYWSVVEVCVSTHPSNPPKLTPHHTLALGNSLAHIEKSLTFMRTGSWGWPRLRDPTRGHALRSFHCHLSVLRGQRGSPRRSFSRKALSTATLQVAHSLLELKRSQRDREYLKGFRLLPDRMQNH